MIQFFRHTLKNALSSLQTYLKLGWPVLALIAVLGISGFSFLLNIAREQDRAYEASSQEVVSQALQALVKSNAQVSTDYGLWQDAFEKITLSNDKIWMKSNYYSSISSAIFVLRPGTGLRFSFVNGAFETSRARLEAVVLGLDTSAQKRYRDTRIEANVAVQPQGLMVIDGRLAVIAVEPIRPEPDSGGIQPRVDTPLDLVVSIKFIGAPTIAEIGRSVSSAQPKLTIGAIAPSPNENVIALAINDITGKTAAWIEWTHKRPGSQAFTRRIIPIGIGLFTLGLLAIIVTQLIVTRQVRLVKLAQLSAEEASKAKSHFLANISHELRTPLNAIIGYSEMIADDLLDADNKRGASDAQKVTRFGHHLLALINDLLDHSKIEAGKMDLNPTSVELTPLIEDTVEALRLRADENETSLVITSDPLLGNATIDGMRLKQCLLNLLSNAVKFTKDGLIVISARPLDQGGVAFVRFSVKDTGIGMSADTLSKLFMPFVQAHEATAQKFGGTGLGLVITRRLVEAMGGSITVESREGEGSCFTILVPRGVSWSHQTPSADDTPAIAA